MIRGTENFPLFGRNPIEVIVSSRAVRLGTLEKKGEDLSS